MKNTFLILCIIFLLILLAIAGCKKYDEGPSFSLRSKKNRVSKEWALLSGSIVYKGTISYFYQRLNIEESVTFTSNKRTYRNWKNEVTIDDYYWHFNIAKDHTFLIEEKVDTILYKHSGSWELGRKSKKNDLKNKEILILKYRKDEKTTNFINELDEYSGNVKFPMRYFKIKKLTTDEMILTMDGTIIINTDLQEDYNVTGELVFKKK